MTGVRHLLLAVVAAVLALALGLALGAGPVVGRSDASRGAREDRLAAQAAAMVIYWFSSCYRAGLRHLPGATVRFCWVTVVNKTRSSTSTWLRPTRVE